MSFPKIAVMLDENTLSGGKSYSLNKDYCSAISMAGGLPLCIPYVKESVQFAIQECDGFFSPGGTIAFPNGWYAGEHKSSFPTSTRIPFEVDIMKGFLETDKPIFGSCHGMQLLAALHGCKLASGASDMHQSASMADSKMHKVSILPESKIAQIIGRTELTVNSRHREYITDLCAPAIDAAHAPDGQIEAIEIEGKTFAIGCQWHQENFWQDNHAGNKLFNAFVSAADKDSHKR